MTKQEEEIKSLQDRIMRYKQELDSAVKALALKRTEMATVAKQTLASLEANIPNLQKKTEDLTAQIAELNAVIADKQQKASAERKSCQAEYDALKESLTYTHNQKMAQMDLIAQERVTRDDDYKLKLAALEARENAVTQNNTNHIARTQALNNERLEFEVKKTESLKDIAGKQRQIEADLALNASAKGEIKQAQKDLEDRARALEAKEKQAEAILARIDEAKKILDQANQKWADAESKGATLNELNVKVLVDTKRQNKREAEQNEREAKLNEREKNLKELEAKV